MFSSTLLLLILLLSLLVTAQSIENDNHESCEEWASMGECDANPNYMLTNCAKSCNAYYENLSDMYEDIRHIHSFYDLKANDIDGNEIDFESLRGKAVLIVNVASYCGYTESHYRGLVELHNYLADTDMVEIMAFPCNQFGAQEPETCDKIKQFARRKKVEFTMMDKVDVNGKDASPVYKFLKRSAGPHSIQWNFATYFLISPDGQVQSHSGVNPMDLASGILELIDKEL